MKNSTIILIIFFILIGLNSYSQTWTTSAPLPGTAPSIPTMATVNGKIYVMGGKQGSMNTPTFEYNPATDTWTDTRSFPLNFIYWATAIGYENKIYLMGGGEPYPGKNYNHIYNTDSNIWTSGASLLSPRMYHNAVLANGKIYLMGGQNGDGTTEWYFDEYDIASNTWSRKQNLPNNGAWYCGAAGIDDNIYRMAGGGYNPSLTKNHFDVYSISNDSWTQKPKLHRAIHAPATAVIDNKIILLGGASNYTDLDSVWIYNPVKDKWYAADFLLPKPMSYHKVVAIDKCLYLFKDGELYKFCPDLSSMENNNLNNEIQIFPNPVTNYRFTIVLSELVNNDCLINIVNSSGQEIYSFKTTIEGQNIHIGFTDTLPDGLYLVRIINKKISWHCKIFIYCNTN